MSLGALGEPWGTPVGALGEPWGSDGGSPGVVLGEPSDSLAGALGEPGGSRGGAFERERARPGVGRRFGARAPSTECVFHELPMT